jgi:phosphoribosylanthranilate isomerase
LRIKICGITRAEDALSAERAGADAIGLIFANSKRRVGLEQAAAIGAALGPFTVRVGVFVNAPLELVEAAVEAAGLQAVQLHGKEDAAYAENLMARVPVIKAVAVGPGFDAAAWRDFPAQALLVDGLLPGSGEPFDWEWAAGLREFPRLILAGGLTSQNVAAGIRSLRPYAVDVASGVESSPGIKDEERVQEFVRAARAAWLSP